MATTTVAPIITEQINQTFYVGSGSLHTIQAAVDAAVESGLSSLVIIPQGYGGGDLISDVVNGTDYIYLTDQRGSNPFYYLWSNDQYRGPNINLAGELMEDTMLDLDGNTLTIAGSGTVYIGGTNSTNATMIQDDGSLSAPNLSSPNADFGICLVDGSPVRTFENTGDPGTGATYPPAGLAVSTGSGWGTSINPSTLATTAQLANFLPLTGGTLTGSLAVNAAAISIAYNEPYLLMQAINAPANQQTYGIGVDQTTGNLWFNFLNDDFTASLPWMIATRSGINPVLLEIKPPVQISDGSLNVVSGEVSGYGWQTWNNGNTSATIGTNETTGEPWIRLYNSIPFWTQTGFAISVAGDGSVMFRSGNTANTYPYTWFYLTRDTTGSPIQVVFNCGVSISGDLNITGAKNFRIDHPTDSTKTLTHSAIEGPECALFYRGEGKTTNGIAEITLPDYFEALTLNDQRTVQVTPLIEEDNASFGACAATRVSNGKFRVCSTTNSQGFYWEVKAIRADIPPLEVIRNREATTTRTTGIQTSGKKKAK